MHQDYYHGSIEKTVHGTFSSTTQKEFVADHHNKRTPNIQNNIQTPKYFHRWQTETKRDLDASRVLDTGTDFGALIQGNYIPTVRGLLDPLGVTAPAPRPEGRRGQNLNTRGRQKPRVNQTRKVFISPEDIEAIKSQKRGLLSLNPVLRRETTYTVAEAPIFGSIDGNNNNEWGMNNQQLQLLNLEVPNAAFTASSPATPGPRTYLGPKPGPSPHEPRGYPPIGGGFARFYNFIPRQPSWGHPSQRSLRPVVSWPQLASPVNGLLNGQAQSGTRPNRIPAGFGPDKQPVTPPAGGTNQDLLVGFLDSEDGLATSRPASPGLLIGLFDLDHGSGMAGPSPGAIVNGTSVPGADMFSRVHSDLADLAPLEFAPADLISLDENYVLTAPVMQRWSENLADLEGLDFD